MEAAQIIAPIQTAEEYVATHKSCGYFARFALPEGTITRSADVLLNHPCFTREQMRKGRGYIEKNKKDEALMIRFHARCVEIYNAEAGALDAKKLAKQKKQLHDRYMEDTIAQTCGVWAEVIAHAHTSQTGETVAVGTLAAVMHPGFVYSKQRQDGGCTIYKQSAYSPSGVESCGAGTVQQIALAGLLLKRNAYVGQQWEKLN
jgi:hypothetical protein